MLPTLLVSVLLSPQAPLLKADFDTGSDSFTYADDKFRSTNQPNYAAGQRVATGGYRGGALQVSLGGKDNVVVFGMSGGWSRAFTVPDLGTREVVLEFRFRVDQTPDYESDEWSEALARVDGVLHGQRPFDYAGLVAGDGNGGAQRTSFWKLVRLRLGKLTKGSHTLALGGYNNKKTLSNEATVVWIDEVRVTAEDPVDTVSGPKAVVALTTLDRFKDNIKQLASFGDRRQGTSSYAAADKWLTKQLVGAGYTVQRHNYTYFGSQRDEIYVTRVGSKYPDRMFIISAHFDGRGGGGAADDDGSGSSMVLEAARAFATPGIETEMSVRFAWWNNEETGLQGSTAYMLARNAMQGVESPANSGKFPEPTWMGLVQHDMILFDHGLPPQPQQIAAADMDIEYQATASLSRPALALAQALGRGNKSHVLKYPAEIGTNMRNTDSWPFRNATPAVSLRENQRVAEIGRGSNPHWHRTTDVFNTFSDDDFKLGYDIARTTIGTIAELVGTFDNRARLVSFGQGCKGSVGTPTLTAPGQLPWLGTTFTPQLGSLPKTGAVVGAFGTSKTTWGNIPLPLNLVVAGMGGCFLYVSPDFVFPLTNNNGTANWPMPIPLTRSLLGFEFFVQGAVADPTANGGGTIVTNALHGTLGLR